MAEDADARLEVQAVLEQYGLGDLAPWAWERIVEGDSLDQIYRALRSRPEWQTRFAAIVAREANGLPPISEKELLDLERGAADQMRRAGFAPGFYDDPTDYIEMFGTHDQSLAEIGSKIQNGFLRVFQAPPEVRMAFAEIYGPSGDSALAMYFLDPDKAMPVLEQQVAASEIVGYGHRFNIDVDTQRAEEVARFGRSPLEVQQAMGALATKAGLFTENVSESEDLTVQQEGLGAMLGTEASSINKVRQRGESRAAAFGGGGGMTDTRGMGGAGRVEQ